jgi:hypothetical protein
MINFEDAEPGAYDGDKLYFHHDDEVGKLKKGISCWDRHLVVKECLVMGAEIIGFTIKTSTVGEKERGGGKIFSSNASDNYFPTTPKGNKIRLAHVVYSGMGGAAGFIDQYGMSVIELLHRQG